MSPNKFIFDEERTVNFGSSEGESRPKNLRMEMMDVGSTTVQVPGAGLIGWLRSPVGRRWVMFGTVSGVAIVVSWISFVIAHNKLGWGLMASQVTSVLVSTIPAFLLSRYWVWAKDGAVSMRREVLPFWILSFVQFFISLAAIAAVKGWIEDTFSDRGTRTVVVLIINLVLYGVMWMGKFLFLNNLLFRDTAADSATA